MFAERISDMRLRVARVGQQLVYNPGAHLRVKEIKTTSTGPAYGEIVSEGTLVNDHEEPLAAFRQRFRAWLGRPRFRHEIRKRTSDPGVATGLAVTPFGGDILFIEPTAVPGIGRADVGGTNPSKAFVPLASAVGVGNVDSGANYIYWSDDTTMIPG